MSAITSSGKVWSLLGTYVAWAIAFLIGAYLLAPSLHAVGLGWAYLTADAVQAAAVFFAYRRSLEHRPLDPETEPACLA